TSRTPTRSRPPSAPRRDRPRPPTSRPSPPAGPPCSSPPCRTTERHWRRQGRGKRAARRPAEDPGMFSPVPSVRRLAVVLTAVAGCAGLCAASAQADSIAYVKDGDAWLASPDGTRLQQVTHTGDIAYVSQADDGSMTC